ncbi:hypothetical protein [Vannielia litorea]|uniref:hypothetical protein n=1 Tax=Vannielia litorea TaxID=1217970 RepID=UPI001BCDECC2|nr:hypothetical protein [Vannielia litorea]MBS8226641.1 hypothetical protein [Vannielia litorea]
MEFKGIFWPAVGEVWRGRGVALRVIWLPLLISALTYELYWRLQPDGYGLLPIILDFVVFSWAAVGWHRAALLEERPGPMGTRYRQPVMRYAVGWFMAVLGAMVVTLGVAVLLLWLVGLGKDFLSPVTEPDVFLLEEELSFPFSLLTGPESLLALLPVPWLWIFLFFNFARALPAVAIERDCVWSRAAKSSFRRWFASAAAWSALLWVPVLAAFFVAFVAMNSDGLWEPGQEAVSRWWTSLVDFASSVVYAINVLIGASVLTIAFRRTASFDDGPDEGARL